MAASTAPSAQRHMPVGRLVALEIPSVVVCSIGPLSVVDVPPPSRDALFVSFGLVGFQFLKSNYFSKFKIQIKFYSAKIGQLKNRYGPLLQTLRNKVSF
jgi:hypothetical protein